MAWRRPNWMCSIGMRQIRRVSRCICPVCRCSHDSVPIRPITSTIRMMYGISSNMADCVAYASCWSLMRHRIRATAGNGAPHTGLAISQFVWMLSRGAITVFSHRADNWIQPIRICTVFCGIFIGILWPCYRRVRHCTWAAMRWAKQIP